MPASQKEYSREWEKINTKAYRLRTPTGWLVSILDVDISVCFVPDPNFEWKLEELK